MEMNQACGGRTYWPTASDLETGGIYGLVERSVSRAGPANRGRHPGDISRFGRGEGRKGSATGGPARYSRGIEEPAVDRSISSKSTDPPRI